MTIELDIPNLKAGALQAFEKGAIRTAIQNRLSAILEEHRKAAIEEMQEFIAGVAVSEQLMNYGMSGKILIRIPDPKE